MKKIRLTQNQFTIVDDSDFATLNKWKWCALKRRNGKFYAVRGIAGGFHETIYMHRVISGFFKTDHKNGDSLDNRRRNLRSCSDAQNQWNAGIRKSNTSGFKGVSWDKRRHAWYARVRTEFNRIFLGYFPSAVSASRAYEKAAKKFHGDFARI
jgi:hypothetical protein